MRQELTRVLYILLLLTACPSQALEQVALQLKWTHAFQFAGYYAAKEQGYYREAGLEVDIREAPPGMDPLQEVLSGKAQFGVGTSSLLLERSVGKPVVALAVIFQHSAYVLIARQTSATQAIHDIVGKRVKSDELQAYLQREGIALDRIVKQGHSYDPHDLMHGKTDAMAAYVTNEAYYLDRAHIPYQTYTPRSAGIDFYGDNLFTTEQEIKAHPERVKAFRAASLRGWKYAMEHPDEMIALILKKYSKQHDRDYFQFEARQTMALIHPELIEVGYMYPGRWRHIADTYADIGMLPREYQFQGFLYEANPHPDLGWLYRWLAAALGLSLVIGVVAYYFANLSRAIHTSEKRYRLITDNAQDVLWELDQVSKQLKYVSPAVERLTGYTPEESMRISLEDALTPASVETLMDAICCLVENPQVSSNTVELELRRKQGDTVWTENTIRVVFDGEGRATDVVGVARDISERNSARAEQQRFISMVSHEFRTPLATIDGAVQRLLASNDEISQATRKRYDKIQQASERLTILLDDYLSHDHIGTQGRQLHFSSISPKKLLQDVIASSSALSSDHHFVLLEEDMPQTVYCDPDLMRLVLRVLTDNAVKYTPPGTEIRLCCTHARSYGVVFLVSDNGAGIEPCELPSIFDKYFRGRSSGQMAGSGLGLHLAHSVVVSHGGALTARNLPQGGAEFRLWLPDAHVA